VPGASATRPAFGARVDGPGCRGRSGWPGRVENFESGEAFVAALRKVAQPTSKRRR
jgi:hypothetical protein